MSTRSRRSKPQIDYFAKLTEGNRRGMTRLIKDNSDAVAEMLSMDGSTPLETLCARCAEVMKKEHLVPSSFLALYFDDEMLSPHAAILGKSPKGNSTTLAERIANVWARNKLDMFDNPWIEKPAENKRSYDDYSGSPYNPNPYGGVNPYAKQQRYMDPLDPHVGMSQGFAAPQTYSGMAGQQIGGRMGVGAGVGVGHMMGVGVGVGHMGQAMGQAMGQYQQVQQQQGYQQQQQQQQQQQHQPISLGSVDPTPRLGLDEQGKFREGEGEGEVVTNNIV
ncbi:hypothetical protein TL16_g05513 [Triparma laevis f. inornata]|uniref:Uncharacterized protein n=1 Tax=Triparma laevis f. inornata TaxID=1714386 RepID=A0A9W7E9W6_9STRA|nr:hypothetical protein TL16_g05513 [Triparma laevis f. inornata]